MEQNDENLIFIYIYFNIPNYANEISYFHGIDTNLVNIYKHNTSHKLISLNYDQN